MSKKRGLYKPKEENIRKLEQFLKQKEKGNDSSITKARRGN